MPKRLTLLTVAVVFTAFPAFAQTWQIDTAHSRAMFAVKDVTKARVKAVVDVNSITTRVAPRDEHLKTADFFDAAKHPSMTFVSTSITAAGAGKYKMTGDLTLRGVTKQVTFDLDAPAGPIKDHQGTVKIGAAASGMINRKDFGVNYHQVLDNGVLGVADNVYIQLDVELVQRPGAK